MWRTLRADMRRYGDRGGWYRNLGFWVGAAHRTGSALHRIGPAPMRIPLLAAYKVAVLPFQLFRKVELPARTPIGEGLLLPNPYAIILPPTVEIGPGCTIHQQVTLGLGPVPGVPRLGPNVRLMPGAKVLGGVTVGADVEVGANVVVTKDVPAGAVIASPVARVRPRSRAGG
jgi:serine O-acetyltransferase